MTTRNLNGSYTVSRVVRGYLVSRTYFGYTKREAEQMFREEVGK